jgi:Ni,Fe-hydrogenase I large subunit
MGANYLMSHILHFYHLVALDYVDVNPVIGKGFFCPNYDNAYYARGIDPLNLAAPAYTVNNHAGNVPPAVVGDLTYYFAGQYVRALKFRRLAHQVGAMFAGKMPTASCYTPGCVTTKPYDPTPGGADAPLVDKFQELMYGGPGWSAVAGDFHPLNGGPITVQNPHPESLLGFIGKPTDFWSWQAGNDLSNRTPSGTGVGYDYSALPLWAKNGIPGDPLSLGQTTGSRWRCYTGTMLFDVVAAAHVFPEYFWIGNGHCRWLAWGIFEGATVDAGTGGPGWVGTPHSDQRLCARGRIHFDDTNPVFTVAALAADHRDAVEYLDQSKYLDTAGQGRHMWKGKTKAVPFSNFKGTAYSYAKTPRYLNLDASQPAAHAPNKFLPYEVGPLARMVNNVPGVLADGGLGNPAVLNAVISGDRMAYYPNIARDVATALGSPTALMLPIWGDTPASGAAWFGAANPLGFPVLYGNPGNFGAFASNFVGDGTLDRIAARALETYYVATHMDYWFNSLNPAAAQNKTLNFDWGGSTDQTAPKKGYGAGLTEAPRGALGHWIKIGKGKVKKFKGKVKNYQIITPTAWNVNPIDTGGATEKRSPGNLDTAIGTNNEHGPIEESIMGAPVLNDAEPIEILRIVHSFDPCIACTVHVINTKGKKVAKVKVEPSF